MRRARSLVTCGVVVALLLVHAAPASARIVKSRKARQVRPGIGFLVGSGIEYQSDADVKEYGFPILLEWALTPTLDLAVEPAYISIQGGEGGSLRGWDDTESTLSLEIVSERRSRPAIALQGGVKWPTAQHAEIGTGLTDYSLGALATKDLVRGEFTLNAIVSHVGVPKLGRVQDTAQLSAAGEWHLTPDLDLTAELLTTQGIGGLRGRTGSAAASGGGLNVPGAGGGEYEATLGLAHSFGKRLKLEEGFIVQSDGTWQVVFAWEWDFGEGR